MENRIKITGIDLVKFVQRVYDFSKPQGLGHLHYQGGGLSDADAQEIIDRNKPEGFAKQGYIALSMDYVHGRACKMTVFHEDGELYIRPDWYDHSHAALEKLLAEFGIKMPDFTAADVA